MYIYIYIYIYSVLCLFKSVLAFVGHFISKPSLHKESSGAI